VKVTVELPAVSVDPVPEESQLPPTVHVPVVSVRVPEVPPVIVTFDTLTIEAFAVRRPPLPTMIAPPVRPRLAVASVVVPAPPWTVRVPAQISGFVAIVNVTVDAPLLNATSLNSAALPGRTAKVMVREADELNVIGARKSQDADVEAFVQEPETVQEPAPAEAM
jgi:hypothetical protein